MVPIFSFIVWPGNATICKQNTQNLTASNPFKTHLLVSLLSVFWQIPHSDWLKK